MNDECLRIAREFAADRRWRWLPGMAFLSDPDGERPGFTRHLDVDQRRITAATTGPEAWAAGEGVKRKTGWAMTEEFALLAALRAAPGGEHVG